MGIHHSVHLHPSEANNVRVAITGEAQWDGLLLEKRVNHVKVARDMTTPLFEAVWVLRCWVTTLDGQPLAELVALAELPPTVAGFFDGELWAGVVAGRLLRPDGSEDMTSVIIFTKSSARFAASSIWFCTDANTLPPQLAAMPFDALMDAAEAGVGMLQVLADLE